MNYKQRSPEWFEIRRGKFTASRIKNLLSKTTTKTKLAEIYRVVYERRGGEPENFVNGYMLRGVELEPEAIAMFELQTNNLVEEAGFVPLGGYEEWAGASPDGFIGEDSIIEVKCPKFSTHLEYLEAGKLPTEYKAQVQFQLLCTGRKSCYFVSYCPKLPLFVIEILPDKEYQKKMLASLDDAIGEVKRIEKIIKE